MKYPNEEFEVKNMPLLGGIVTPRAFLIRIKNEGFVVLASEHTDGWEHISVSHKKRTPTWQEMCHVKDLFFDDEEMCIQFHPKKSEYVNECEHCLHIWHPPKSVQKVLEDNPYTF